MSRSPQEEPGRGRRRRGWLLLMLAAFASGLALIGAALFWPAPERPSPPKASPFAEPENRLPEGRGDDTVRVEPEALIAIVAGDLGYDPAGDAAWLDFPGKITLAVLPFGPSSRSVAASAQSRGHCVILHVPMEPRSQSADGTEPFRLKAGMGREEIAERLARMAAEVPQAVGAMNHMGSAFTTDPAAMDVFAEALKGLGYFFIDGATAPGALGLEASSKAEVLAVQRDVFLDDDPSPEAMRRQWDKAVALSKKTGAALLVCHSRKETLGVLRELVPSLREEGIRAVTVPELLAERLPGPGTAQGESL